MPGWNQAKIRVQPASSLTLFPPKLRWLKDNAALLHLEARQRGFSPPCILDSVCQWLSATPRDGLCNLPDIYRWGSSCELRTIFQRIVHSCALRGWHLQNLEDGCASLVKGSVWGANASVTVREGSAGWVVKETAIIMESLNSVSNKVGVSWPGSLMCQLVWWYINSLMHSFGKYVLHAY